MYKFIAGFLILSISALLSSVCYFSGLVTFSEIPFVWYLTSLTVVTLILFKAVFKSTYNFKRKILKFLVKINKAYNKVDPRNYLIENTQLTSIQEKSIKLWNVCISDKRATLLSSIKSNERQIENDIMLITLTPFSPTESVMTIFDTSDGKRCLYEVHISDKHLVEMCANFDNEVQKRIKNIEVTKRNMIQDDLDTLLTKQVEKCLV